jgi:hypothetical protein
MTKDEALKLALEALEENHHLIEEHERPEYLAHYDRVISAVSKALAASVQKRPQNCGTSYCSCVECVMEPAPVQPVAWLDLSKMSDKGMVYATGFKVSDKQSALCLCTPPAAPDLQAELDATNRQVEILSDALAESRREVAALKAVQEPFGYFRYDMRLDAWVQSRNSNQGTAFYTTPPAAQRPDVDAMIALARADEREACAKVAGWLWQQFQDTKEAHERNSPEPFRLERFGFDQSTVQQSKRMMDAIRARENT